MASTGIRIRRRWRGMGKGKTLERCSKPRKRPRLILGGQEGKASPAPSRGAYFYPGVVKGRCAQILARSFFLLVKRRKKAAAASGLSLDDASGAGGSMAGKGGLAAGMRGELLAGFDGGAQIG